MRGSLIIFQREIASYFVSPIAYLVMAAILLLTGVLFNRDLTLALGVAPANPQLVPVVLSFMMIIFAPLLTMRLFAEERREGTLELLMTAPIPDSAIVLGKFLGAWCFYSIILLVTLIYQVILASITSPDLGHALGAYIGIWLYGGAMLTVGMFFSSLSENQIVAAFLSVITLLLLWLGDQAGLLIANIDLARLVRSLSFQGHFSTSFASGILRAEDIVFFAGVMVIMLYVTIRMVESQRWR